MINREVRTKNTMDINRKTAYLTLLKIETEEAYSNIELNHQIRKNRPDQPAFVRELTYGTLRWKYTLDHYLNQLVSKGFRKLKPDVLTILRMGAYQIAYMDSVPDYAALDESVRLAKKYCRGRDRFVNGVLRNFLRRRNELPGPETLPDPVERLSAMYSFDPWITALWTEQMGIEKAASVMAASCRTPDLTICVNRTKMSSAALRRQLEEAGCETVKGEVSPRILHVKGSDILDGELFREGCFFVQDEASASAVEALAPRPGELILDVCAAPGGKSMTAAELMHNAGTVRAFDLYEHRAGLIGQEAERLGFSIVQTGVHDATRVMEEYRGQADRVICDVPCSGLGVLRKKPEIKYRKIPDEGASLTKVQYNILQAAAVCVKPGGFLMYSTCTIHHRENEDISRRFLKEHPAFLRVTERQLLPDEHDTDGFYYCVMKREEDGIEPE